MIKKPRTRFTCKWLEHFNWSFTA